MRKLFYEFISEVVIKILEVFVFIRLWHKIKEYFKGREDGKDRRDSRIEESLEEKVDRIQEQVQVIKSLKVGDALYKRRNTDIYNLKSKIFSLEARLSNLAEDLGYVEEIGNSNASKDRVRGLSDSTVNTDVNLYKMKSRIFNLESGLSNVESRLCSVESKLDELSDINRSNEYLRYLLTRKGKSIEKLKRILSSDEDEV